MVANTYHYGFALEGPTVLVLPPFMNNLTNFLLVPNLKLLGSLGTSGMSYRVNELLLAHGVGKTSPILLEVGTCAPQF